MRKPICLCGRAGVLIELYDTYACEACNKWLEKKCSDDKCEMCVALPDKPFKKKLI